MQIPGTDDLSDLERTRGALTILGRRIGHVPTFQNLPELSRLVETCSGVRFNPQVCSLTSRWSSSGSSQPSCTWGTSPSTPAGGALSGAPSMSEESRRFLRDWAPASVMKSNPAGLCSRRRTTAPWLSSPSCWGSRGRRWPTGCVTAGWLWVGRCWSNPCPPSRL